MLIASDYPLFPPFVKREWSFPCYLFRVLANCDSRYKPDVKIRFITEELGFESDEQSARFILDHSAEDVLLEKDGAVRLLTGVRTAQYFEMAKANAHRVIDIKGQI